MKRFLSLVLVVALLLPGLVGCGDTVGEIAGNVADAAKAELEKQVQQLLDEYKVDVIEVKTAVGELNGSGKLQFFCGVLVTSNSTTLPQSCADALGKLFEDTGVVPQNGSKIDSDYLQHKDLSFQFSAFDDGRDYYLIYAYTSKLPSLTSSST